MGAFNFTKFHYFDNNGHELPLVYNGDVELKIDNIENPNDYTSYYLVTSSPDASIDMLTAAENTSLRRIVMGSRYDGVDGSTDTIYMDSSVNGGESYSQVRIRNTENNHYFDVDSYMSSNGVEYYPELSYNNAPVETKEAFLYEMGIDSSILKFPSVTFNTKINFNKVSTGLVETQAIYILVETERAYNSEYGIHAMVDCSTYADLELDASNNEPADYINRYQLMFFIDCRNQKDFRFFTIDGDDVIWSDRHFVDLRDGKLDLTFKNGFRVDVGFMGEQEGYYEQDMYVCIIDTSTATPGYPGDSYPIGVIRMTAETEGKDERYDTLFANFGIPKIDTFDDVFRDSEISNDSPDYISMNKHAKKVFLTYSEIFPYVGSYKALFNAVKMLGYDDIFFKEWYKDIGNNIYDDNGYITYVIDPSSSVVPSQMYGSNVDERIHIRKMNWLSMMYKINEELNVPDDKWGFPTAIPNINYYNTNNIIKLISLKKWLERYIIGVNCRITDIGGEGVVFERYSLLKYGSYQQIFDYDNERPVGINVLNETEILQDCSANIHVALSTRDSDLSIESFEGMTFVDFCRGYFDEDYCYHVGNENIEDSSTIIYFGRCLDMNDNMNTFELRANGIHENFRFECDGSILSKYSPSLLVDDNEIFFDPYELGREDYRLQKNSAFVSLPVIIEYTKDYVADKTTSRTFVPSNVEDGSIKGAIAIDSSDAIISYMVVNRYTDSSARIYKTIDGSYYDDNVGDASIYDNEQRTYGLRFCLNENGIPCFKTLYYMEDASTSVVDGSIGNLPQNSLYEKYLKLGYPIDEYPTTKKDVNGRLIFNDPKHNRRIILVIEYDRENDERKIHVETINYSDVFTLFEYRNEQNSWVNRFTPGNYYGYFCNHYLNNGPESVIKYNGDDVPINVLNGGVYTIEAIMMDEYNNMFGVTSSKNVRVLSPEIKINICAKDRYSNTDYYEEGVQLGQNERDALIRKCMDVPIYSYTPKFQVLDSSALYDGYIKLVMGDTAEEKYMRKTSMCQMSNLSYKLKPYGEYGKDASNLSYDIFVNERNNNDDIHGFKFARKYEDVGVCASIDGISIQQNDTDSSILSAFKNMSNNDDICGSLIDCIVVLYNSSSEMPLYSYPYVMLKCNPLYDKCDNMYMVTPLSEYSGYHTISFRHFPTYDVYIIPSWAIPVNFADIDSSNIHRKLSFGDTFPFDCSVFDNNVMKFSFGRQIEDSSYYGFFSSRCKSEDDGSIAIDTSVYDDGYNACRYYMMPKECGYISKVLNLSPDTNIKENKIYLDDTAFNRDLLYYIDGTNTLSFRDFNVNDVLDFIMEEQETQDMFNVVYRYNSPILTLSDGVLVDMNTNGAFDALEFSWNGAKFVQNYTTKWKIYKRTTNTKSLVCELFNDALSLKLGDDAIYDLSLSLFDGHGNKYYKSMEGAFGKLTSRIIIYELRGPSLSPLSSDWIVDNTYYGSNTFDSNTKRGILYLKPDVYEISGVDSPFYHNNNLLYVDLSSSGITTIGEYAFYESDVQNVYLPDTLTTIGEYAFYGCNRLLGIDFTENVTTIENYAFYGCMSFVGVEFGENITTIGDFAFGGDDNLLTVSCLSLVPPQLGEGNFESNDDTLYVFYSSIGLYEEDEAWSSAFSNIVAFNIEYQSSTSLWEYASRKNWVIHNTYDSNTHIGHLYMKYRLDEFEGFDGIGAGSIVMVDFRNSMISKIDKMFIYSYSSSPSEWYLQTIHLPKYMNMFSNNAFERCNKLSEVYYYGSITDWLNIDFGDDNSISEWRTPLASNPVLYCYDNNNNMSELTSLTIPTNITKIKQFAFCGYRRFTDVIIHDDVTEIGRYAFYKCSGPTYINIPQNASLGENALYFVRDASVQDTFTQEN